MTPTTRGMLGLLVGIGMSFSPSAAEAGLTFDTYELAPAELDLPSHEGLAIRALGWEPDRVEKALLTALTDGYRGAKHKHIVGGYDVETAGPNAQSIITLNEGEAPPPNTLVLEVTAREPTAEDKLKHRRVRYDHQWRIVRRTELRLDFQVIDPSNRSVAASSTVSRVPKREPSIWHTDEEGAVASAPSASEMAIEVLDDAIREIADAVAPRWQRRKYTFAASDLGKSAVDALIESRRVREGAERLVAVARQHPNLAAEQFNAALVLALIKDFVGAREALQRARAVDDKAPYKKLAEKLPEWERQFKQLTAAGFPIQPIALGN
ncbi:MAG: hypothetical protein GY898_05665 [Proteobacteria bacterium]|nr:hypothetical protein [Pseudomonadota bacterium]